MVLLGAYIGEVITYDVQKGFGFIKPTHRMVHERKRRLDFPMGDVFIHFKHIVKHSNEGGIAKLEAGEIVQFLCARGPKGHLATQLEVVGNKYDEFMEVNYNTTDNNGGHDEDDFNR